MAINNPLLNVLNTNSTNPVDLLRDIKVPPQPKRFGDRFRNMTPEKKQGLSQMLYLLGGALKGNDMSKDMAMLQQNQAIRKAEADAAKFKRNLIAQGFDPSFADSISQNPQAQAAVTTQMINKQMGGGSYQGTGLNNQFLNDLERGAKDPEFRKTTRYKTAYDQMTKSKTSTYMNEVGQPVTRTVPGLSKNIYPTPFSATPPPESVTSPPTNNVVDERGAKETVGISTDRRKLIEKDIGIVDGVVTKLDSLEEVIVRLEPGVFTVGIELAEVDSAYNSVLLELKNYAELGVLAGPDMDLLEKWIGNPTTIKQAIKGGDEGTLLQLRQLRKAALEVKNKGLKELGQKVPVPEGARSEQTAYLNGRTIIPNADKSGWVYKDTGEPAQ